MKQEALAYLEKELHKANLNLVRAFSKPNGAVSERDNLKQKVAILEYLIKSIGE